MRATVLVGLALLGVTSLAFAFAPSVLVLDIARFLQGVGAAATWAGAFGWLIGASPRERRGEMIGTAMAAAIAGALFGPALGARRRGAEPGARVQRRCRSPPRASRCGRCARRRSRREGRRGCATC